MPTESNYNVGADGEQITNAETLAWMAAVVVNGGTVSNGRGLLVQSLIVGLKTDAVWTLLDRLWLFAGENTPSALTDIVATSLATNVNSTTFTVDRGYTGNGSNMLIDSNFNPTTAGSPKFVQDSGSFFAWSNSSLDESNGIAGYVAGIGSGKVVIYPRQSNVAYWEVNGTAAYTCNVANTDGSGFYSANRSNATSNEGYKNGSLQDTAVIASTAPANGDFAFLTVDSLYSTRQCSAGGFGQSLDGTKNTSLYNRLRTYMTAVGVP